MCGRRGGTYIYALRGQVKDVIHSLGVRQCEKPNEWDVTMENLNPTLFYACTIPFLPPSYWGLQTAKNKRIMKRHYNSLRFIALAAMLTLSCAIHAGIIKSGFCGADPNPDDGIVEYGENLSWSLTDDGVLTISGSGRMYDYESIFDDQGNIDFSKSAPWADYDNLPRDYFIKKVIIEDGVASIGNMAFYECSKLTEITIPDGVTSIGKSAFHGCLITEVAIPESVASIGEFAFSACSKLTKVTIPESVTSIGEFAFSSCSNLTEVILSEGVTSIEGGMFCGCWCLTEITIPKSVTTIGEAAFESSGLTEITIPESVNKIWYRAFDYCNNLKTLNYNAIDCKIVSASYSWEDDNTAGWTSIKTLNIGDNVKTIPDSAFRGCTGLSELTIPENVAKIGSRAFYKCNNIKILNYNAIDCEITSNGYSSYSDWRSITTLNIGRTVKNIPDYAFSGCTSITEIVIPRGVTYIGAKAFSGCSAITNLVIPESVTQIGCDAFHECRTLTTISIPESVTAIPNGAFSGCALLDGIFIPMDVTIIGENAFSRCSSLSSIVIPDKVTEIGGSAFLGCSSLPSINVPESVTKIGRAAFSGCSALTSVSIPESVTAIPDNAFSGCSSLDGVIIPQSVTSIGSSAFNGCSSLSEIVIPEGVTEIGENAFFGCSALPSISVPESVTKIGSGAFRGCSSLVSVLIPEGVTIDGSPFGVQYPAGYPYDDEYKQYPLLESLIIRSDIDYGEPILNFSASPLLRYLEVPANVFNDGRDNLGFNQLPVDSAIVSLGTLDYKGFEFLTQCRNTLRHIDLSAAENTELPSEALSNCLTAETFLLPTNLERVGHSAFSGCKSLRSIVIPASVTDIDDSAFEDCRQLTDITFGNDPNDRNANTALSRIGNWAFYNCHLLEHLSIPEGVTEIGNDAFHGCESLKDLELPSTIQTIGNKGFASGSSVQRISVRATDIPSIEEETFADVSRSIPVYVPDEYVDAYRNAPYWKELNIVGVNTETSTDGVNISALYRMEDGRIVLTEEMPVSIYTVTGALIYSGTATEVPLPVPGIYLLRIGEETVKVVRP